jgi:arylsulfatase A-like enzyme
MSAGRDICIAAMAWLAALMIASGPACAQSKPNILVIMADDIGYWNISAYNRGMMGYHTPNIDRIANEGAILTDYYGQQSCTAGRAAFITGQSPMRTGLLKVGLPGAKEGLSDKDPTLAELLKPLGYATGQFGKNHLGDRNEFLPTVHGFDEFFGNLYHLNAEDEPEHPDYPKNLEFKLRFGPRGVLRCTATLADTPGEDPRFGKWGRQSCYSAGDKTFKVHLDGYDQRDVLAGKASDNRHEFFYWTDDGDLAGLRYDQYKAVFMEQQAHGLEVWIKPFIPLRAPKLFNLRSDPFERSEYEAGDYVKWFVEHAFVLVPAQAIVAKHLASFQEFPPRQRPGSFSVGQAMEMLTRQKGNN